MPFKEWILVLIFGILDSGATFFLNMCILVVGARSLRTGQRLNPHDLIHVVMGVVNIALQCLLLLQGLISIFFISLLFNQKLYVPTMVSTLTLIYFTYWLTAWLCLYYCVTISSLKHPIFVWSKRNISMFLPHLLVLTALGCFLISVPLIWIANVKVTLQSPVNSTLDPIVISGAFIFHPSYIQTTTSMMGCCVPFLLILVSIVVTISSLFGHIWKMRHKDSGLSQVHNQAQVNAIRSMFHFLTISIIFYINEILFFTMSPNPEDPQTVVGWLIFMSFPTAESLVIIFANPKMRKHFMIKSSCFPRKLQA